MDLDYAKDIDSHPEISPSAGYHLRSGGLIIDFRTYEKGN